MIIICNYLLRFINRATNGRVLRDSSRSLESKIERHLFYAMHAGVITKRTARSSWIKDGGACSQREARAELLRKHAVWSLSGVIYAMIRRMKLCTTPEDFEPFFRHRIILLVSSLLSTPTNPISQRCLITRVHSRFLRRDSATCWLALGVPSHVLRGHWKISWGWKGIRARLSEKHLSSRAADINLG